MNTVATKPSASRTTVRESLDLECVGQKQFDLTELLNGHDQIQVKADHRFHVSVDRLPADNAVGLGDGADGC